MLPSNHQRPDKLTIEGDLFSGGAILRLATREGTIRELSRTTDEYRQLLETVSARYPGLAVVQSVNAAFETVDSEQPAVAEQFLSCDEEDLGSSQEESPGKAATRRFSLLIQQLLKLSTTHDDPALLAFLDVSTSTMSEGSVTEDEMPFVPCVKQVEMLAAPPEGAPEGSDGQTVSNTALAQQSATGGSPLPAPVKFQAKDQEIGTEMSEMLKQIILCPITKAIMQDPVVAGDGNTYERSAISEWLKSNSTSPITREVIDPRSLTPNRRVKDLIGALTGGSPRSAAAREETARLVAPSVLADAGMDLGFESVMFKVGTAPEGSGETGSIAERYQGLEPQKLEAWSPDFDRCQEPSCRVPFSKLGAWRHHCRSCGQVFCGSCSNFFAPLPEDSAVPRQASRSVLQTGFSLVQNIIGGASLAEERMCEVCFTDASTRRLSGDATKQGPLATQEAAEAVLCRSTIETLWSIKQGRQISTSDGAIAAVDVQHCQSSVSRILLSKLRLSQYCTSKVYLETSVKQLLWHNRHVLSGHSSYAVPLVHCIDWDAPSALEQSKEVADLLRQAIAEGPRQRCSGGPRKHEHSNIMCSSNCSTSLGPFDAMHILGLRVPSHHVHALCTELLLQQDECLLACFVPVLVRVALSLNRLPRCQRVLEQFLCELAIKHPSMSFDICYGLWIDVQHAMKDKLEADLETRELASNLRERIIGSMSTEKQADFFRGQSFCRHVQQTARQAREASQEASSALLEVTDQQHVDLLRATKVHPPKQGVSFDEAASTKTARLVAKEVLGRGDSLVRAAMVAGSFHKLAGATTKKASQLAAAVAASVVWTQQAQESSSHRVEAFAVDPFQCPICPEHLVSGIDDRVAIEVKTNGVSCPVVLPLRIADGGAPSKQESVKVLFKQGDDLRKDYLISCCIRMAEAILKEHLPHLIHTAASGGDSETESALTALLQLCDAGIGWYRILPITPEAGFVEYVGHAETLYEINEIYGNPEIYSPEIYSCPLEAFLAKSNTTEHELAGAKKRLAASIGVWFTLSYMFGLGDRHADNVMVGTNGVKFDIDYQCLFGEEPNRMTEAMLGDSVRADAEWLKCVGLDNHRMINIVRDTTFKMMRRHTGLFMCNLRCMADMDHKYTHAQIEEQLSGVLMPGLHDEAALHHLDNLIRNSTTSTAAMIRDWFHQMSRQKVVDQGKDAVIGTMDSISSALSSTLGSWW
eukprot:TRINITY_DN7770_c0_g3_i1.p1 TRINITY_DN7770_c0_g3~~TRINITY_DN7770_c0_g3_i1.p1  ORF type:complete len:1209 (-),score=229.80 TRINITY_DN7770_c0_g3_i1:12-3638(-)